MSLFFTQDESSSQTDTPEVSNAKQQLAQSYMEHHRRQTQLEHPATLMAIPEDPSGSGDSEEEEEEEEDEEEEEEEEEDEKEEEEEDDEETEQEGEQDESEKTDSGSQADSASSDVLAEEVE
jgi:hypothetical protein